MYVCNSSVCLCEKCSTLLPKVPARARAAVCCAGGREAGLRPVQPGGGPSGAVGAVSPGPRRAREAACPPRPQARASRPCARAARVSTPAEVSGGSGPRVGRPRRCFHGPSEVPAFPEPSRRRFPVRSGAVANLLFSRQLQREFWRLGKGWKRRPSAAASP